VTIMKTTTWWKETFALSKSLRVHRHASSLAYYAIFALGPIFLVSLALSEILTKQDVFKNIIVGFFNTIIGISEPEILDALLHQAKLQSTHPFIIIISVVIIFFTILKLFIELRLSTTELIDIPRDVRYTSFFNEWIIPFLLTLLCIAGIPIFITIITLTQIYIPLWILYIGGILVIGGICSLLYRIVPKRTASWKHTLVVGYSVSFIIGLITLVIRLYATTVGASSLSGISGALFLLLLWIYISAYLFYLGAIIIRKLEHSSFL
jgi:membrane protein